MLDLDLGMKSSQLYDVVITFPFLQVLQCVYSVLPSSLRQDVLSHFDSLLLCIKSQFSAVRHMASKAVSACTLANTGQFMNHILEEVVPLLGASHQTSWRQGAIESIYRILC